MKKTAILFGWYHIYYYICLCKNDNNSLIQSIMTTKEILRQSVLNLVLSKFSTTSCYFTLSKYEDLLLRLTSYKLSVLYKLLFRCFTNGMTLNFDTVYMLTFDYAFTLNFSEFLSHFTKDMQTYECTLSAPEMLSLIDYLNLTYDESVS